MESGDELAFSVDIGMLPTHCLMEAVISPECTVVGHRVSELPMPDSPYTITVVAMSRRGRPVEGPIDDAGS